MAHHSILISAPGRGAIASLKAAAALSGSDFSYRDLSEWDGLELDAQHLGITGELNAIAERDGSAGVSSLVAIEGFGSLDRESRAGLIGELKRWSELQAALPLGIYWVLIGAEGERIRELTGELFSLVELG